MEAWGERSADLGRKEWLERRPGSAAEIRLVALDRLLPFVALEELGVAAGGLDGLDIALARRTDAQEDASFA